MKPEPTKADKLVYLLHSLCAHFDWEPNSEQANEIEKALNLAKEQGRREGVEELKGRCWCNDDPLEP